MPPSVTLPGRRRLTWCVHLDMPVHLTPPRESPEGLARGLVIGEPEPGDDRTEPGWLVLLGVSNTGWSPIRCTDFAAPLCFIFPGRQVLGAWLSSSPEARRTARPAPEPAIWEKPRARAPGAENRTASSSPGISCSAPPTATASQSSSPELPSRFPASGPLGRHAASAAMPTAWRRHPNRQRARAVVASGSLPVSSRSATVPGPSVP